MGTHPIFESDFDCLTDSLLKYVRFAASLFFAKDFQSALCRPIAGQEVHCRTGPLWQCLFRSREESASVPWNRPVIRRKSKRIKCVWQVRTKPHSGGVAAVAETYEKGSSKARRYFDE